MRNYKNILHLLIVFLFALCTQIFFLLCMPYLKDLLGSWYTFVLATGSIINFALLLTEYIFYLHEKEIVYKSFIIAYVLFVFALILLYVLFRSDFFEIVGSEESLEAYLEKAGSWMSMLFIALQFLQVVILPIPSFVTVAAGTALFGPLQCSIYSLTGILVGSIVAFFIGRYAGSKVVSWLIGEDTLKKWLKQIKGKDKVLLSAMFLLPVFPDDVLCFVAGLSSMSFLFFFTVIGISRVLAIFATCYSVSFIPFDTWWGIALWAIFFIAVAVLFVLLYKKSDEIQEWIYKKFHRESRIREKKKRGEFRVEIVNPDGCIVEKGIEKSGENDNIDKS